LRYRVHISLRTALDIVLNPRQAAEAFRCAPSWRLALVIAIALTVLGHMLQRPAKIHVIQGQIETAIATNPRYAQLPEKQKSRALANVGHVTGKKTVLVGTVLIARLLAITLINALVLSCANLIGRGTSGFPHLWAASVNIAVPTIGISSTVLGVIFILLGPDHFSQGKDLLVSLPGLQTLVPAASGVFGGFARAINPFTIWGCALNTLILRVTAEVTWSIAIGAALLILFGAATFQGITVTGL